MLSTTQSLPQKKTILPVPMNKDYNYVFTNYPVISLRYASLKRHPSSAHHNSCCHIALWNTCASITCALLDHAHRQSLIIDAIVRLQQDILGVDGYPALLNSHIDQGQRSCWTPPADHAVYLVWCCIAVLGEPSLDRNFLQLALTNDSCDPPTYCGHCNTFILEVRPKHSDAWWNTRHRHKEYKEFC